MRITKFMIESTGPSNGNSHLVKEALAELDDYEAKVAKMKRVSEAGGEIGQHEDDSREAKKKPQ